MLKDVWRETIFLLRKQVLSDTGTLCRLLVRVWDVSACVFCKDSWAMKSAIGTCKSCIV